MSGLFHPNPTSATSDGLYPKHIVYPLNDGSVIPSPAFGVGSALYQKNATEDVLLALKNKYRHLDNAAIYKNEESVGDAIRQSGLHRKELYLTSKFANIDGDDVRTEFNKSLAKLGVDYLDLYLIHFPSAAESAGGIAKVWKEFELLKAEGLVKSIGVSNFGVKELTELLLIAKTKPAVNQIRYHAYNALENAPLLAFAALNDIKIEAYSSLSPITKFPGGPADAIAEQVAHRISTVKGDVDITVSQATLDWVKTKGIVIVTTSGKNFRQKEQLEVVQNDFPEWLDEEIEAYEKAGPGWDKKN
ncbi:Aldo/keto reductase family proteins [Phaffia rhodozyma]|uniref:Aldo/keto reductase family proteins n=1 Tax=Phaffia rhodozyma TaxID=264483 RepID=A0A0F7SIN2_PHARH|nr:Aldo/keto reductase family proteins [Phaffia rhodozyma]